MEPPSAGECHVRSGVPLGPFIFTEEKTRISRRTPVHTLAHANLREHPSIFKMRYLYLIKSNIDDYFKNPPRNQTDGAEQPSNQHTLGTALPGDSSMQA